MVGDIALSCIDKISNMFNQDLTTEDTEDAENPYFSKIYAGRRIQSRRPWQSRRFFVTHSTKSAWNSSRV